MSENIIKNEKKEYGVMQNIIYLVKNMWKWEKGWGVQQDV